MLVKLPGEVDIPPPQDGQTETWTPVSSLQWNVKELTVGKGRAQRTILREISGEARNGTFTIILGPSGAGKTSLLECLSLRVRDFSGVVLVDGAVPKSDFFSTAALVYQQELLPGYLTPREHIMYHATARMNKCFTKAAIKQRVQDVIDEMGLVKCADTIMGGAGTMMMKKGISGGERKRVSLAVELLQCPAIIFLDEPCSGLDSVMSEYVVTTLSELASSGRIVITSLHSPSSDAMALVTHVMLLTCDGRLAYQGTRAQVVAHFQNIGHAYPKDVNPAEFLLKIVSRRERESPEHEAARMDVLARRYQESPIAAQNLLATLGPVDMRQVSIGTQAGQTTFWLNYSLTSWRLYMQTYRQYVAISTVMMLVISIAFLLGLLYLHLAENSWRSVLGVNFSFVVSNFLVHALGLTLQFPMTNALLNREVLSGINRPGPYLVAIFTAMPHWFISGTIGSALIYWMTGMPPLLGPFLWYCFINNLCIVGATGVAIAAGSISHNSSICLYTLGMTVVPMVLFSGILYDRTTVLPWVVWLEKASVVTYAFRALMIKASENMSPNDAQAVRTFLHLNPDDFGLDLVKAALISVGLYFVAYIFLKIRFAFKL